MDQQIESLINLAEKLKENAKGLIDSSRIFAAIEYVINTLKIAESTPEIFTGLQLAQEGDIKNGLKITSSHIDYRLEKNSKKGRPRYNCFIELYNWIQGFGNWNEISERTKYKFWNQILNHEIETPIFHVNNEIFHDETYRLKLKEKIENADIPAQLKKIAYESIC